MKIIIEQLEGTTWNVIQDDKYSEALSYDEMLGLISALAMPVDRPCLTWLKTKEQHDIMRIISVVDLLTNERREDMLCGALEGGSNYWYFLPDVSMIDKYRKKISSTLVESMMKAIVDGNSIPIHDLETIDDDNVDGDLLGFLNIQTIRKGEQLMRENAPQHFANILSESDDAETADVWFQYCVLGDIVYG